MKAGLRRTIALALGVCTLSINTFAATTSFTDVPRDYWGYSFITRAATENLVSGMGDNQYGPEETLSNAHFITMVCNLFYKDAVARQAASADWWRPYMNTAYSAGILSNTTVGQRRGAANDWTASMAEEKISRYDMAQVIVNISNAQGWESASVLDIMAAKLKIKDWSKIPDRYQNAVTIAYAKGFLSGDQDGNFNGDDSTTRAQAAVVLCSLYDAKTTITVPSYTNSTRLVNGKSPTEENVYDALTALKSDYPEYFLWDGNRSYTSSKLGTGTGSQAFAYLLSDKVFGAMAASKVTKESSLRAGDVVYLSADNQYVVVLEVSGSKFTYVTCNASGWIIWSGSAKLDDLNLSGRDTAYTRYLTKSNADSNTLADGSSATEKNVTSLLKSLKKDYAEGDKWDESYRSTEFGRASGDEGFAYMLSDEIFGDLKASEVSRTKNMRVGDVVLLDDGYYGVVVSVDTNNEEFEYVYLRSNDKISWGELANFVDVDTLWTRYPSSSSSSSDTLANGKSPTVSNVEKLLSSLEDDYAGESWRDTKSYTSDVLGKGTGPRGFAYRLSDEIFGDLDRETVDDPDDLQLGDLIYLDREKNYVVVVEVDHSKGRFYCAYVDKNETIQWGSRYDIEDLDTRYDTIYTRYPSSSSSTSVKLKNGNKATAANVTAMLEELMDDYRDGYYWDEDEEYKSNVMGTGTGNQAFVYFISDEVFGKLEYTRHRDPDKLKVGDVFRFSSNSDDYGIVVAINSSGSSFTYANADSWDEEVVWNNTAKLSKLDGGYIYTRY